MIVKLPFGGESCAIDLRGLRVRRLTGSAPAGAPDSGALLAAAVDAPLDGAALGELVRGHDSAVVVVPDATRKIDLPGVLPVLLDRLFGGGLAPSRVTVLIACGTHPWIGGDELPALVGELPRGVTVAQHDSRNEGGLVEVGQTSQGRRIRLDRRVVDADLLLTVGSVCHHYFAGFGGGPKMIFPGVAGYSEIQANHSQVLESVGGEVRRHPSCEPGVLHGNPVADEIAEVADLRPPDMAVCLVPGRDGRPAWAGAGSWRTAFGAAVATARSWYEVGAESLKLVVTSAGGAPSDATLIQAHKAVDAGCRFLEAGGEILVVARIDSGAGSCEMAPFLDDPRPPAILERLARQWIQYGHTTLRLVEKTHRFRIHLYSEMDRELAGRLGFLPVESPEEVIESWRGRFGGETVGLMMGPPVYPAG